MFSLGNDKQLRSELTERIAHAIASFARDHRGDPVAGIEFKYETHPEEKQVWVRLDLHTNPDWQLGLSDNEIAHPKIVEIELSTVRRPAGPAALGKLIRKVYREGVGAGHYEALPKAATCSAAIEHAGGEWGWLERDNRPKPARRRKQAPTPEELDTFRREIHDWMRASFETFAAEHTDARLTGVQLNFESNPDMDEIWVAMSLHTHPEWEPGNTPLDTIFMDIKECWINTAGRPKPDVPGLGALLLDIHERGCAEGLYAPLPKAERCSVTIDQLLGKWSWPEADRREVALVPA